MAVPITPALALIGMALLVAGTGAPRGRRRSTPGDRGAGRVAAVAALVSWLGRQRSLPECLGRHGVRRSLEADALIVAGGSRWFRVLGVPGVEQSRALTGRLAALRLLCLAAGSAVGAVASVGLGGGAWSLAVALAALGLAIPDGALRAAATRARRRVDEALPRFLDLVAAGCSAGLGLDAVLSGAAEHVDDSLRAMVTRAVSRQRAGEPLAAALRREAERAAALRLVGFAVAIERHHRLGRPLAGVACRLADAERARRWTALRARAGRSVALGSLVVATVITPACVVGLGALTLSGIVASGIVQ